MTKRSAFAHKRATPLLAHALWFSSLLLFIIFCASPFASAQETGQQQQPPSPPAEAAAQPDNSKRLGVRLRSFVQSASGSLHFEPTTEGGIVRLTVLGLSRPEAVMPGARTFVVWASASGARVFRVGELQLDQSGNGGLQFTRPPALDSYSVLVTAEPNALVERPTGAVVFASLANEVTAFFAEVDRSVRRAQRAARELERRARRKPKGNDFYSEVDEALRSAPGGGRTLELFGQEIAPGARGRARATTLAQKAYVRAQFINLPLPGEVNASSYVLWSTVPDGRIIYMGSLPATVDLNNSDVYVRVAGFNSDFDLFVTAEKKRPVARPSDQRALASSPPTAPPE